MWRIVLNVPGNPTTYFAKRGGYTSDADQAKEYRDSSEADKIQESLSKSSTTVSLYSRVEEVY